MDTQNFFTILVHRLHCGYLLEELIECGEHKISYRVVLNGIEKDNQVQVKLSVYLQKLFGLDNWLDGFAIISKAPIVIKNCSDLHEAEDLCRAMLEIASFVELQEENVDSRLETAETVIKKESAEREASKPHCPYCNSTNLKKIGTASRLISVRTFGLAGGKIGKQWHCNSCKSDF